MDQGKNEKRGNWTSSTMNKFIFCLYRLLRNETDIVKTSADESSILADLSERSVAIVGNSRALAQSDFGRHIDQADVVVRINAAPMPDARSHGTRTTWLALAVSLGRSEGNRIGAARVLWMSHKRKRLPYWVASSAGFYLHPLGEFREFSQTLSAPPTTGLMMIELVARSNAASIDLYGFDFFESQSLTGRRTAAQVPHDFAAERNWVNELKENDPRLVIHGQN